MAISVYKINKGINKPIEFKGLKAQYIWYLGAGILWLMVVFAVLYMCGVNTFVCLGLVLTGGTILFMHIYKLSHTYGQYGMMKMLARRSMPKLIKVRSRKVFIVIKAKKS